MNFPRLRFFDVQIQLPQVLQRDAFSKLINSPVSPFITIFNQVTILSIIPFYIIFYKIDYRFSTFLDINFESSAYYGQHFFRSFINSKKYFIPEMKIPTYIIYKINGQKIYCRSVLMVLISSEVLINGANWRTIVIELFQRGNSLYFWVEFSEQSGKYFYLVIINFIFCTL